MSTEKSKPAAGKTNPAPEKTAQAKPPGPVKPTPSPPPKLPPLFRRIDWVTFGVTAVLVFIGYFLTLSPDLTLQDSGELATGSFYAGVPHPPGYPLWTIFTWLFTVLVPVANVAYRVSIASAVSGALATGLLALIVSRGSSMFIESIAEFKDIDRRIESAICMVSGFVAGVLLAYNGYMWSQSVIVEVYPFSVLSLMGVVCLLLRWTYAPHQRRYLYWAWLLFGICFTNHQTLIVAAMGIEITILAAQPKLGRDLLLVNSAVYIVGIFVLNLHLLGAFEPNDMVKVIFHFVGIFSILGCGWLTLQTQKLGTELLPVFIMFGLWVVGFCFYFYMPLSSMTNPPMNWGYPRTLEGFIHALTRGQYEKANPTNFFNDPVRFLIQLRMYFEGATEEFNIVNLLIALVPFVFFIRLQKRERAWLIGLTSIWFFLAILLMILLNPTPDRATKDLIKVFFTASYTIIAMMIGYGLTLISAFMVAQYQQFRRWGFYGGLVAVFLALYSLTQTIYSDRPDAHGLGYFFHAIKKSYEKDQFGLTIHAGLLLLGLALAYALLHLVSKNRPQITLALAIFTLLPMHSIMSHWFENEQRGHLFGYWFGHDMFTPPFGIYPEMTRDAVLFGGTDPGRFCPTYMIFCESFIPPEKKPRDPKFDRRDVYIITQNALADGTYLEYIRAHYDRSTQIDPPFFQELLRPKKEVEQGYKTNVVARLAYDLLDKPFLKLGAHIEARRRKEGVYPKNEIYTPTPEDSSICFQEYMNDAAKRLEHDQRFPNEPKQIKPMEDVHVLPNDNRIQVAGQVAVMSINGLLTKVIFEHNPTNEFFVEESFPLDWMFPNLTPFGVIMKINRQPVPEITDDIIKKDHEFWTEYSKRFIGNWITYDTSVKQITDFIEKVYLERDFSGFAGDRKFIRDDDAQKAFSKLRSSIAGIYAWRLGMLTGVPTPQQYNVNYKSPAERDRMAKEADFAFKQAFAYCPFSPEAVYRYVNFLISFNRLDDALLVASTCLKLDPYNGSIQGLVKQLMGFKENRVTVAPPSAVPPGQSISNIQHLEQEVRDNPTNFQAAFGLVSAYLQSQQSDKAAQTLDQILANPHADVNVVVAVANGFAQLRDVARLQAALEKLVQVDPQSPEAWYDLATIRVSLGRNAEGITALKKAMELNAARLAKNSKASNLLIIARTDSRFAALRKMPEFQQIVPSN